MKATALTLVAVLILTFSNQICLVAATTAADAQTAAEDTTPFIASIGQHTPIAGLEVEVFDTPEGLLNYRATMDKKSAGPAKASIHKDSAWFMYAASSHDIWIYDGADSILRIQFTDAGTTFQDNHAVPGLLANAPQKFSDRLPKGFHRSE